MKLASDLGVKISFGSDAHCPNTPAYAFDQLEAYARSYGYTSSVIFENRKPREIGF
jgi:histidinol-phosphatase (PHP family)